MPFKSQQTEDKAATVVKTNMVEYLRVSKLEHENCAFQDFSISSSETLKLIMKFEISTT